MNRTLAEFRELVEIYGGNVACAMFERMEEEKKMDTAMKITADGLLDIVINIGLWPTDLVRKCPKVVRVVVLPVQLAWVVVTLPFLMPVVACACILMMIEDA